MKSVVGFSPSLALRAAVVVLVELGNIKMFLLVAAVNSSVERERHAICGLCWIFMFVDLFGDCGCFVLLNFVRF